jgi:hypothetical protein
MSLVFHLIFSKDSSCTCVYFSGVRACVCRRPTALKPQSACNNSISLMHKKLCGEEGFLFSLFPNDCSQRPASRPAGFERQVYLKLAAAFPASRQILHRRQFSNTSFSSAEVQIMAQAMSSWNIICLFGSRDFCSSHSRPLARPHRDTKMGSRIDRPTALAVTFPADSLPFYFMRIIMRPKLQPDAHLFG